MYTVVKWLRERPIINVVLVILFYLLVTLPHEQVGVMIAGIFKGVPRTTYDLVILCLAGVLFLFYFIPLIWSIVQNQDRSLLLFYFAATFGLTVLSINTILIFNVELIHFIQYAAMAILLFPLIRRYADTIFWIIILGAMDEAYQYWVLSPHRTNYYDFNDVIIDMLGGVFGLLLLRATKVHDISIQTKRPMSRRPVFMALLFLTGFSLVLWLTNFMTIYPDPEGQNGPMLLVKKVETSYWTKIQPNIITSSTFHVIRPLEGLIVLILLYLFYLPLWKKTTTTT